MSSCVWAECRREFSAEALELPKARDLPADRSRDGGGGPQDNSDSHQDNICGRRFGCQSWWTRQRCLRRVYSNSERTRKESSETSHQSFVCLYVNDPSVVYRFPSAIRYLTSLHSIRFTLHALPCGPPPHKTFRRPGRASQQRAGSFTPIITHCRCTRLYGQGR